jgi:hypothetical protein
MIPANMQLDLKKLAAAAGAKKLKMASHREAEQMTGLQVGGDLVHRLAQQGIRRLYPFVGRGAGPDLHQRRQTWISASTRAA